MVLGVLGKKRSGKDTLAGFIKNANPEFRIYHFAKRLKDVCEDVFDLSAQYFYEDSLKEIPIEHIKIDEHVGALEEAFGIAIPEQGLTAKTPRELLQYVGTDYVRAAQDDYWIKYIRNKIIADMPDESTRRAIISDVRFLNEAAVLGTFPDGHLLRVVRTSQKTVGGDQHPSEREQESIACPTLYLGEGELAVSELCALLFAKGDTYTALKLAAVSSSRFPSFA